MFRGRDERARTRLLAGQGRALARATALGLIGLVLAFWLGPDPVAFLGWITLVAAPAGYLVGAARIPLWPYALGVPGAWAIGLVWVDAAGTRHLPGPLWGISVVSGFFALGLASGCACSRALANPEPGGDEGTGHVVGTRGAGVWLLLGLLLSAPSVQGALSDGSTSWARTHPGLARAFVDLSPLGLALECAGWDWTHAQPEAYAVTGVEWFPRRPYRGPLAGSVVLLVGCVLGMLASRPGRRIPGAAPPQPPSP